MSDPSCALHRPSRRFVLFALSFGLVVAWWDAFHEVVCGFTLAAVNIKPIYAYAGCYAHSLGCILGAVLAPVASRRLVGPLYRNGIFAIIGVELLMTVLLFFHLGIGSPIAPTVLQIPVNALACILALLALETLARFSFAEIGSVLVVALCSFALVNYGILPMAIHLPFGIYAVLTIEVVLLAAAGIAIAIYFRLPDEENDCSEETPRPERRAELDALRSNRSPIAWQPLCFMAAYGMAFGLMHVESSYLIRSFPERSVWLLAGIACATVVIALFVLKLNKRGQVWPYYRSIAFPLIICAFLMLQERSADVAAFSVSLAYASMAVFCLLTILACIRISSETAIPFVRVARLAIVTGYASGLIGMSINHYLTFLVGLDILDSQIAAIAVFIALCAATFWIGDDRSVNKIWGWRIEKDPRSLRDEGFERRIAALADEYGLTAREQTILALLARGQRTSQISEEQFISVNTVRTHMRNVYSKLNVHSHQDLMKKLADE